MKLRILVRPRARQDLLEHYIFIVADDPAAALRVIDTAERAFELLAERPEVGTAVEFASLRLAGLRRWVIPEFSNYMVYYVTSSDSLDIVRILHGAREQETALEGAPSS